LDILTVVQATVDCGGACHMMSETTEKTALDDPVDPFISIGVQGGGNPPKTFLTPPAPPAPALCLTSIFFGKLCLKKQ
jgi:hypothetical protein